MTAKPIDRSNDGGFLRSVELEARGLDRFGPYDLQIMRDLRLPQFDPVRIRRGRRIGRSTWRR